MCTFPIEEPQITAPSKTLPDILCWFAVPDMALEDSDTEAEPPLSVFPQG